MRCQLGSSQGTRMAGPHSEKSDCDSLPTTLSPLMLIPQPPSCCPTALPSQREWGQREPVLYSHTPHPFYLLSFSFSLFFSPYIFFCLFFLLLQLPKASQGPPPPLQPPEHLPQSSPLQLGAPFPIQFLTSCSRVPLLSRRHLSHLKQVSLLCSELSSHLAKTID